MNTVIALKAKNEIIDLDKMKSDFTPGGRLELHMKDLQNALDTGHQVGVPLPLTAFAMEMMQALKADGLDQADHCVLVKYYEKLANIKISKDK
jgi:2-hydroxy-3-oxopropionate reductase